MTSPTETRPRGSGLALPVIAAAQLLIVMDGTIVTVGLPVIGSGLGIAETDLDWVLTSYALAFGGMLLAGGRAGDLFGRRRLFRAGLVVFLLSSLLGGIAQDGVQLIAARALQGVGGALIAPAALSLLADTFPAGPRRNQALGVYGAMGGLGSVVGLLLGGALTEYLGWRWIMFVNIPIALVVLAGTVALVPGTRERGGIDLPGAGIASGLINTSQQVGGALGLAILASVAVAATRDQPAAAALPDALTHGYTAGLLGAGAFYLAAILVAVLVGRRS
jgi:MFS family permease